MQNTMQVDGSVSNSYDASNNSAGELSPLSQFPLLNSLSSEKKQTKDGQPPKRRGPKPDSKPALTRRQELNRQAQRTHRERKEMYIKALEQEVLRLKDVFAESTRERDRVQQENMRLKNILAQHGISYDFGDSPVQFKRENSASQYGPSSSGSISGSYQQPSESTAFTPPPPNSNPGQAPKNMPGVVPPSSMRTGAMLPSNNNNDLDYDQIGIDFVLTYDSQGRPIYSTRAPYPSPPPQGLERPCMGHMQYLVVRSHNSDAQEFRHPSENADDREHEHMSGHALMGSCPPHKHIVETPNVPYPFKMPDLGTPDLTKLLDLSARLPLNPDSEITPIMAWTMIYRDPRLGELNAADLERIKVDLAGKVRCYGFGAVLEEFEVRDALSAVFSEREANALPSATNQIAVQQIAV